MSAPTPTLKQTLARSANLMAKYNSILRQDVEYGAEFCIQLNTIAFPISSAPELTNVIMQILKNIKSAKCPNDTVFPIFVNVRLWFEKYQFHPDAETIYE